MLSHIANVNKYSKLDERRGGKIFEESLDASMQNNTDMVYF